MNEVQILTNLGKSKLQDEFTGSLLDGKIQIASNIGYPSNKEKLEENAVASIVRNNTYFLNIVADEIGSSKEGSKASLKLVRELTTWFITLNEGIINNQDLVCELLQNKINQIDEDLYQTYQGKALTTFALTLTTNEYTIIANLGNYIAYQYNEKEEYVEMLTTPDSWASDSKFYENVRYNIYNNIVTAGIGAGFKDKIHINIIKNQGQKIILSTNGITGLISEETFTSYFKNDVSVKTIIEDAIKNPDTEYLEKKEDNISAIIIKLPNNQTTKTKQYKLEKKVTSQSNGNS